MCHHCCVRQGKLRCWLGKCVWLFSSCCFCCCRQVEYKFGVNTYNMLKELGANITFKTYNGMAHGVSCCGVVVRGLGCAVYVSFWAVLTPVCLRLAVIRVPMLGIVAPCTKGRQHRASTVL